jgi:hypothetical protein
MKPSPRSPSTATRRRRLAVLPLFLLFAAAPVAAARDEAPPPRSAPAADSLPKVAEKVGGLAARPGLLVTYLDANRGKIWLELPPPGEDGVIGEYLYIEGLLTGLGSNPVGLDRGQIGETRVVRLRRLGSRLLVEEPNLRFRALSDDPRERQTVAESFATSVLWGAEIAALDADGRSLVDFTPFVVRDAHGVARTLQQTGQGSFSLDAARSALDPSACLSFPDNLELEAVLTFGGQEPGAHVRATAPQASSVTLVQHHSLVRLPDAGYRPRAHHPQAGSFAVSFMDFAAPLGKPLETRWIARHRLEHEQPGVAGSPVREPIVFYVDSGAPEPIRTALLEGASWWAEAFAAAGFPGAYRVELLPEGVHPLDVRYNVIQWVHRSTRGWSYGGGVIDPRTGEFLKGHVTLGSLRVRQDILIFEGLLGTEKTGTGAPDDPVVLALRRIRQLSAHEVGHALGLTHNFAASGYDRGSVMDYPVPLVGLTAAGELDLSQAYASGAGAWDVNAIRYAYEEAAPGTDEGAFLGGILADGARQGLRFLTDEDARPAGAAQPWVNLWDNGTDPAAELEHVMKVREVALAGFGERNLAPGKPLALLQEVLAPIYLWHRYQVEATAKAIGGLDYDYAVRGDAGAAAQFVDPALQRRALAALLSGLRPEALDLPEPVLNLLLPRPFGYDVNREMFEGQTGLVFDPLGAAATAADLVLANVLQPERLGRVADFHRRDGTQPSLEEVLGAVVTATFPSPPATGPRHAEIGRVVQRVTTDRLVRLAADATTPYPVKVRVEAQLQALAKRLAAPGGDGADAAHRSLLRRDLTRYLEGREWAPEQLVRAPQPPPGSPIGSGGGALACER